MPTDLERRLLTTLIHDLDSGQLRRLVMHVAETHLELVGTDALRIKEESQKEEPASSGLLSGGTINTQPRRLLVSESPAIESALESHARSDDELQDEDYVPTTTSVPSVIAIRTTTRPVILLARRTTAAPLAQHTSAQPPKSRSARLHKPLHGLRTPSRRKSLERIAGIIDTFNWKTGTRNDLLNRYIGNNEHLASGWPAIINAHGKRLRRYSEGFRGMYPAKAKKERLEVRPEVVKREL